MEQTEQVLVTKSEFVGLLIMTMCCDPAPKDMDMVKHYKLMDEIASQFGYAGWIDAYRLSGL